MAATKPANKSRHCETCGIEIFGRSDKKYCSDQCRAVGNSEKRMENAEKIKHIHKALRTNFRILTSLCPQGKIIVPRAALEKSGFNFNYFTSLLITRSGTKYFGCYDLAFAPLLRDGVEYALIVKFITNRDFDPWR